MLKIEGLKKTYDHFHLDCTLEVRPGSVTGLIGQNGAGKSTTFKAVLGLISPDGGRVEIFGKDVRQLGRKEREQIGVVLSDSGFSAYLTGKDLLAIESSFYEKFDQKTFLELCGRFAIPLDQQIRKFSTGMRAKLKLIAAITHGSSLLILDEPTAGMDVVVRDEVLELLREYMEEDEERSILLSSHISSDLENLCDDFYMIHQGQIIFHEETDVLLSDYAVLKADPEQMSKLDQQYLLRVQKEHYGYKCLTNQKQFYLENYPGLVVEKGSLDELITMMIRGNRK